MNPTDTIWKFSKPLEDLDDEIIFTMPRGAKVISVINQREHLTIYAIVEPHGDGKRSEVRRFRVAGTGHPIGTMPVNATFLGTVQFRGGDLVFHVWEL